MKPALRTIRILSDGRPGHENQSVGLAEALRRRTGAAIETVRFENGLGLLSRIQQARALATGQDAPQLLVAAGHRTHLPLLLAARKFGAKAVVIMNPSLPTAFFDLCFVPRHDLHNARPRTKVVATRGALNRLPETAPTKVDAGVILLGGPSKHHDWNGAPLLAAIEAVVRRRPALAWTIANSRRTPAGFLDQVRPLNLPATLVPHEVTTPGWLPAQLSGASEVWVTEDSTSMIFEAITARAQVGLLPMVAKRPQSRLIQAVNDLVDAGYATRYVEGLTGGKLPDPSAPLHEAGRCADEILNRFFSSGVSA